MTRKNLFLVGILGNKNPWLRFVVSKCLPGHMSGCMGSGGAAKSLIRTWALENLFGPAKIPWDFPEEWRISRMDSSYPGY